jgi:hypothetical protein
MSAFAYYRPEAAGPVSALIVCSACGGKSALAEGREGTEKHLGSTHGVGTCPGFSF